MDKLKQVGPTRRLILGFCVLISIFLLFGLFTLYDIHRVADLTRTIYNHPLVVSNAALQSNISIAKMHRSMKDVVLLNSLSRIQQSIEAVNEEEKQASRHLDIVKNRILGEEGKDLENKARNLLNEWRPIRKEVIGLVREGQREKAANITIGKGANHVALLEEKMLGLTKYATKKASDFMHEAKRVHSRLNVILISFLLLGLLTSFLVAFFTIKRTALTEKTLKRLITENVELKMIFESSLRTVNMDPIQIEQMVVNLVTNAGDAMPKGGTLTIETANVDLDEDFFRDLAEKERPGSYVMLAVTDTGNGMDAKTQEHMFDPFYTTKEVGMGTGLGLSMVYGIAKQNEGVISVDSEIGQGSTFKIYLPIAKKKN